jgi:hypothetical protein
MQGLPSSRLHVQEQGDRQQTTNADVVYYGVALISDECKKLRHAAALTPLPGRLQGDDEARMKGDRQLWGVTLVTLLTFGHLVLLNLFCGIIELFFSIKKGHKFQKPLKVQKKLCRLETTSMIMISAENSCA